MSTMPSRFCSFEFFMWPSYMTNITPPLQCMDHFKDIYGRPMPVRIGGTTQDRATYDPNQEAYVSYSVDNPLDAPMELTYGPKFFDLIRESCGFSCIGPQRVGGRILTINPPGSQLLSMSALKPCLVRLGTLMRRLFHCVVAPHS
jgi:hypothetical protein